MSNNKPAVPKNSRSRAFDAIAAARSNSARTFIPTPKLRQQIRTHARQPVITLQRRRIAQRIDDNQTKTHRLFFGKLSGFAAAAVASLMLTAYGGGSESAVDAATDLPTPRPKPARPARSSTA